MKNIEAIQEWFKLQCNGDWEHEYGVKIQTINNPGWNVHIDLSDTVLDGFKIDENLDNGDRDWFFIQSDGKVFSGSGDSNKLNTILDKFVTFALDNIGKSDCVYTVYARINLPSNVEVFRPLEAKMIDLSSFEIVSIPDVNFKDLKVLNIDDFEKLDFTKLNLDINFNISDNVKCDLIYFYDHPSLIIL
ncbi:Immunity protein 53 [Chryseobacterium taeanense]|uniref:Immunity protein 53 n=1 Tax=Chryseobacterium taeanense TaxID=311334 RepID=A0A1G8IMM1_9FLAO|nr:immunity 53 family protein [Chryseobacterium taeanense]SDI19760.1 Immunity protein 53 [Chryseobacterium taeanense]